MPWLGAVPTHWEVLPNRALFEEIRERGHPEESMLSVTITKGVIPQQALLADTAKKDSSNQDKSAYKLVRPGDVVYNKMRAWQGAIGVSRYTGIVSPAYVIQRPRPDVLSDYMHYLLRTPRFAKEAERWSYGITSDQWSLRPEHFKMIYSCLPPAAEQAAVVRFLDYMDRRIQRYIRVKQKLIKLLEEQKQAIIHRSVTQGLDPDVRRKPSGVEWLGDVPEHWEVLSLRRKFRVVDCKHLTVPFVDEGIPLASVRETQSFELDLTTSNRTTPKYYARLIEGRRKPRLGDLIYCRNVGVGAAALVTCRETFAMGQDVCLIRSDRDNSRWLNYFLHSKAMATQLELLLVGSTFKRVNVADIKAFTLVVPPREEQDRIATYLDREIDALDVVAAACRREQALLREYRTRLIADVVTGKLDVREAAAQLPDEDDYPNPMDASEESGEAEDSMGDDIDARAEAVEA